MQRPGDVSGSGPTEEEVQATIIASFKAFIGSKELYDAATKHVANYLASNKERRSYATPLRARMLSRRLKSQSARTPVEQPRGMCGLGQLSLWRNSSLNMQDSDLVRLPRRSLAALIMGIDDRDIVSRCLNLESALAQ